MNPQTIAAIRALLAADPSVTAAERAAILSTLEGKAVACSDCEALLTPSEAAAWLRISRTEFWRRRKAGVVQPSAVVGVRQLFRRSALLSAFAV